MDNYCTHCFSVELATKVGMREAVILQHLYWWHEHNKAIPNMNIDGRVWFFLSAAQIAEVFPYLSEKVVRTILERLIADGYLMKDHKGHGQEKFNRTNWYALTDSSLGFFHLPKWENGDTEKGKSIVNNNKVNKEKLVFIPPTPQEISDYSRERGFVDPEGFARHFIDYYTEAKWHLANGKPMKDWRKAVITWEPNNKDRYFSRRQTTLPPTPSPSAELRGPRPRHDAHLDVDFSQFYKD